MPDDRMIHRRMLRGDRIASLTDFERGVWLAYQLIADDYGVMRLSAVDLQKAVWLERKPKKTVQKAFEVVVKSTLITSFQDGDRTYVYQPDWNTWQNVRHPRGTIEPCPPIESLRKCDERTTGLFLQHPRCPTEFLLEVSRKTAEELRQSSGNVSAEVPKDSGFTRAPALAEAKAKATANAEANGERQFGSVMAGRLPKNHLTHAWCGRVCVPEFLHNEFERATGQPEQSLYDFYRDTFAQIAESEPVDPDALKFWRPRVSARWTPSTPSSSLKPEDLVMTPEERAADAARYGRGRR